MESERYELYNSYLFSQKGKRCTMDLISREDAIRWVKTECNPYGKPTLDFESGKKVIEYLEQMPSAQPGPYEDAVNRAAVSSWLKQYGQNALRGIGLGEDRAAGLEISVDMNTNT